MSYEEEEEEISFKYVILAVSILISITFTFSAAQISPGSSLSAADLNRTWSSPNITFSVGFTQVRSTNSFAAGINYFGGVWIWTAGIVDSGGALRFTSGGSLLIVNGSGSTVWNSRTTATSAASIEDSGNQVLRNSSGIVWSSSDGISQLLELLGCGG